MDRCEALKEYQELVLKLLDYFPTFRDDLMNRQTGEFWEEFHLARRDTNIFDNVSLYGGMSRYVFVIDGSDYALKMGTCNRGDEDCEREVETYKEAQKEGVAHMFAAVEYGFSFLGKKFYLCERADADEDLALEKSAESSGCSVEDIDPSDIDAVQDVFYCFFSNKDVWKFIDFCDEHGINDIHMANIGFDGETVKCIDYAGF